MVIKKLKGNIIFVPSNKSLRQNLTSKHKSIFSPLRVALAHYRHHDGAGNRLAPATSDSGECVGVNKLCYPHQQLMSHERGERGYLQHLASHSHLSESAIIS